MAKLPAPMVLRMLLIYDPVAGTFIWLPRLNDIQFSQEFAYEAAGKIDSHGYLQIRIHGQAILAHRIAWAMMTGRWPKEHLDHANGKPLDNRWINLRTATRSQNRANSRKRKDNKSGYQGAYLTSGGKYEAIISVNKKTIRLGTFKTAKEAGAAYQTALKKHFGEYAYGGYNGV